MSAFLVPPTHIAILARKIAHLSNNSLDPDLVGETLAMANLSNLDYLYKHHAEPGKKYDPAKDFRGVSEKTYLAQVKVLCLDPDVDKILQTLSPQRLFGMAQCLEYQSSDQPNHEYTQAHYYLTQLMTTLAEEYFRENDVMTGWSYKDGE